MNILLVHLGSTGDCLFATAVARQIKELDYPGCHLTWMIGSKYRHVLMNNHYVNDVIEVPIDSIEDLVRQRDAIPILLDELRIKGRHFEEIFITDFTKQNYKYWYGTTRSAVFRSYPKKIKVAPEPVLCLTDDETLRVRSFAAENRLCDAAYVILFECSPRSGQSNIDINSATEIAKTVVGLFPNAKVILSSSERIDCCNMGIIDGSILSYRENAELTKYCNLLVGCSSGISWLNTSNWAAKTPMLQIVNSRYRENDISCSVKLDFEYFGLSTDNLIELEDAPVREVLNCIESILKVSFAHAKRKYDIEYSLTTDNLRYYFEARMPFWKKLTYIFRAAFRYGILKKYQQNKPAWFAPRVWVKRLWLK